MNANLAGILLRSPEDGATALVDGGSQISYEDLAARASGAAARFVELGIGPGGRVALFLPNGAGFVTAYFGALWAGAVVVPLNVLLREGEIDERLAAVTPGRSTATRSRASWGSPSTPARASAS